MDNLSFLILCLVIGFADNDGFNTKIDYLFIFKMCILVLLCSTLRQSDSIENFDVNDKKKLKINDQCKTISIPMTEANIYEFSPWNNAKSSLENLNNKKKKCIEKGFCYVDSKDTCIIPDKKVKNIQYIIPKNKRKKGYLSGLNIPGIDPKQDPNNPQTIVGSAYSQIYYTANEKKLNQIVIIEERKKGAGIGFFILLLILLIIFIVRSRTKSSEMQGMQGMQQPKKKESKIWIILLIAFIVISGSGGGYYYKVVMPQEEEEEDDEI